MRPATSDEAPDSDRDSVLGDLLAPFDRLRMPRPATPPDESDAADEAAAEAEQPPPPASARFPDTPPPTTPTRTSAAVSAPAQLPPLPPAPPHVGAPETEEAQRAAEYRLRPPMPSVPPSDPATAGIPVPDSSTASAGRTAAVPGPSPRSASGSAEEGLPDPGLISSPAAPPASAAQPISPPPALSPRTTAARRAVGAVDLTPGPGAGRPFVSFARPALYDDSTTRLRPVRSWVRPRVTAAAACVVLGLGLIGGAATGSWLTGGAEGPGVARDAYAVAGELWHSVPVDQLFPATIKGEGAGPGGADRTWTRVAVAPDSSCKNAFDPLLRKALAPAGCLRLLRATYTDATRSHVTTVGLLFTKADADAMRSLRHRFTEEGLDRRTDLMPRPYPAKGTPAADFGDAQRASWTVSVLPDAPVVAFSVSGFADGRTVGEPEPAEEAMKTSATTAPAQAGLGNEAKGIADRVERRLRKTIAATEKPS
ncbi:hypothetical protein [Streptomyces sp. NPDC048436]|uniref:hypothetical protein n=1 Tax=Streptomyces sp. NPDC048436 TaxID=3365550 RepID=UPI003712F9C9